MSKSIKGLFLIFAVFGFSKESKADSISSQPPELKRVYADFMAAKKKENEEVAKQNRTEEAIIQAGGDRASLFKACGMPRRWTNNEDVQTAKEWIIVPEYVSSKTFPTERRIAAEAQTLFSIQKLEGCDYISIQFEGKNIKNIDRSKCKAINVRSDTFKDCYPLLGY